MTDGMEHSLTIGKSHYLKMQSDVSLRAPEEACGLVAGRDGHVDQVYIISNALHSPTAFRMDPQEQIEAFLVMEKYTQELLAIYHSHPTGPEEPSETDRVDFAYPGVITIIWFLKDDAWDCRAFWIKDGEVTETTWTLVEDE